ARLRYHCGFLVTGVARVLNLLVVAGGIAAIVMVFVIEKTPQSVVGLGLIGVGVVSVVTGMIGVCAASRNSCFGCYLLLAILTAGALATSALSIYLRPNEVRSRLHPRGNTSDADVKQILRIQGGIFAGMFVVSVAGIVLAFFISCCDLVNYNYEDLESSDRRRTDLQKIREDAKKGVDKKAPSRAAALADKMREKYGKFSDEFGGK
ncbi:hypothetical protein CBR_g85947, partial [Chara braunii]